MYIEPIITVKGRLNKNVVITIPEQLLQEPKALLLLFLCRPVIPFRKAPRRLLDARNLRITVRKHLAGTEFVVFRPIVFILHCILHGCGNGIPAPVAFISPHKHCYFTIILIYQQLLYFSHTHFSALTVSTARMTAVGPQRIRHFRIVLPGLPQKPHRASSPPTLFSTPMRQLAYTYGICQSCRISFVIVQYNQIIFCFFTNSHSFFILVTYALLV